MGTTTLTAATLKAILCYIDPINTPKIAFDDDRYTQPLIDKIKMHVGDRDGSQSCSISFSEDEKEMQRQFNGVCSNIHEIFKTVLLCTAN